MTHVIEAALYHLIDLKHRLMIATEPTVWLAVDSQYMPVYWLSLGTLLSSLLGGPQESLPMLVNISIDSG